MHIERLTVTNFRSFYGEAAINFATPDGTGKTITMIYGENGHGKSNLLNAIHWCITGKTTTSLKESKSISAGQLIVFEIELSIHLCAAACIRM